MGTAAIGAASFLNPGRSEVLAPVFRAVGAAFTLIAAVLLVLTFTSHVVAMRRRGMRPGRDDLTSATVGPLYATFPGGMSVVALAVSSSGVLDSGPRWWVTIVTILGVVGTVLALLFTLVFYVESFSADLTTLDDVNGSWFVPLTVVMIGPILLARLANDYPPEGRTVEAVLAVLLFGSGIVLFLLTAALLFSRLILAAHPPASSAPTLWIMMSPLSIGGLAALAVGSVGQVLWPDLGTAVQGAAMLLAASLWGFAVWWLAVAGTLMVRRHQVRNPFSPSHFHPSAWGLIFPLGALTVCTLTLADRWGAPSVQAIGVLFYVGLVVLWFLVAYAAAESRRRRMRAAAN